jgi:hypothetical protein
MTQAFPLLQMAPARLGTTCQPKAASQRASWQASMTITVGGEGGRPAVQVPCWQVSLPLQASPSTHSVPFGFAGFEHWPVAGSQTPASWQESWAAQVIPKQRSIWHVGEQLSPLAVLPSSHSSETSRTPLPHTLQPVEAEQAPVAGSQAPAVVQPDVGVQVTGLPPAQLPA